MMVVSLATSGAKSGDGPRIYPSNQPTNKKFCMAHFDRRAVMLMHAGGGAMGDPSAGHMLAAREGSGCWERLGGGQCPGGEGVSAR